MASFIPLNQILDPGLGSRIGQMFLAGRDMAMRRQQLAMQQQQLSQQAEMQRQAMLAQRQQVLMQQQGEERERQANQLRFLGRAVRSGLPVDRALSVLRSQGVDVGSVFGGQVPSDAEAFGLAAESFASGELGAEAEQAPLTEAGRIAVEQFGLVPGTDAFRSGSREIQKEIDKQKLRRAKASATIIGDRIGASKKLVNDLSNNILQQDEALNAFGRIRELASVQVPDGSMVQDFRQFLSVWNKGRAAVARFEDFASIPVGMLSGLSKEDFNKAQDFRATVDKFRAEEFKRLLGSAQSKQEIENLINTIISTDMTPVQFERALSNLERLATRSIAISNRVLREGIEIGTGAYRKRFSEIDMIERANEVAREIFRQNPGMSKDEVRAATIRAMGGQGG